MVRDDSYIYHGDHFVMNIHIESLYSMLETNMILYIIYTWVKKINQKNFLVLDICCSLASQ